MLTFVSLGTCLTVLATVPEKNVKCLLLLKLLQTSLCLKQLLPLMKQQLTPRQSRRLTLY